MTIIKYSASLPSSSDFEGKEVETMRQKSRWLLVALLTSSLFGGFFGSPLGRLEAAPRPEKSSEKVLINVNKADASELEKVRGIGPLLAQRIVEDRRDKGSYEHLEDLIRVPGIGQATFEKIKSQITL